MSSASTATPVQTIRSMVADPSPIGLFGLAMVTLVASSQKLGLTEGLSFVIPWALFLGGLAQLYASISDAKLCNTFGATAFGAYGFFWLAVSMSWLIKMGALGSVLKDAYDPKQLGVAFVGYLIFTVFMTIGAAKTNKVLFMIFFMIIWLFVGLSLNSFEIGGEFTHMLAAVSELIISLLSFYLCAAIIINGQFKKIILPIGKPF